ncbi:MAG: methyltransferase domain-containing protein [Planctomycetota bacterium]
MTRMLRAIGPIAGIGSHRNVVLPVRFLAIALSLPACVSWAHAGQPREKQRDSSDTVCRALVDERLREPLGAIAEEYTRRTGSRVTLDFRPAPEVRALLRKPQTEHDLVLSMPADSDGKTPVSTLPGATTVAWKHPSGEPVWAAVLTDHSAAAALVRFAGGPTGHRLWSESTAGFTITSGKTHAEAFDWVVEHRVKHTYPMTAVRMLGELGGIREGVLIDVGCGTGNLDVELAKRSAFTITGLDIDPDMKPLFEKRVREAGLQNRICFVTGDAQQMPFPDDYADVIVSRGTLTFIPDIAKCLQEVDRVLKPTGVAFLGGRYLYTPQQYKISNEKLKTIVAESGVPGAKVVEHRGQWVKIVGPEAPAAAHQFQAGPHLLADRFIADYGITEGKCLVVCPNDAEGTQSLQRGFVQMTDLEITALYPSEKVAGEAEKRIREESLGNRITSRVGTLDDLPFDDAAFDLVAGVGPVLIWGDRAKKMREVFRVLRPGGVALVGGRYLGMPEARKVSSETLRDEAAGTGIPSVRVLDDMGQWVEILKGISDRGLRDRSEQE